MGIESQDQPDNVSSAQKIQPWLRRNDLHGTNPDIHSPLKGAVSQCTSASSPICRDCVWGIREFGKGSEGEFGEVDGINMLGCFQVLPVELRHKSPCTF